MQLKTYIEHSILYSTTASKLKMIKAIASTTRRFRSLIGLKNNLTAVKRGGLIWNLDLKEGIDFCLFATGAYEPDVLNTYSKLIKQDSIVLDIGANIGAHTLHMAKLLGRSGHLYAFEPTNYAYKKLINNLKLNEVISQRVTTYKAFLTEEISTELPELISSSWDISMPIEHRDRNPLDKGFAHSTLGAKVMTLDSWAVENNINKLDLIKLDVDGFEIDVLRGGKKTIQKLRPKLIIELSPIHFESELGNFADQIQILKDLNYRICDVYGSDIPLDTNYLEQSLPYGTLVNVIATPK
jgi:FkbM family methyltransferase